MNKNTLIGMLLMAAVIFGFMWLRTPSAEELEAKKAEQEQAEQARRLDQEKAAAEALVADTLSSAEIASIVPTIKQVGIADSTGRISYKVKGVDLTLADNTISGTIAAGDTVITYNNLISHNFDGLTLAQSKAAVAELRDAINNASRFQTFARYLNGEEKEVTLENNLISVNLSSKGAQIARATLKDYINYLSPDSSNVVAFGPYSHFNFAFNSSTQRFETDSFFFEPVIENDSTVLMNLDLGKGAQWGIRYTLPHDSYILTMEVVQKNMQDIIPQSVATLDFNVNQILARNEEGRTFEQRNSALWYKFKGDSPDDLSAQGDDEESLNQEIKWIAFKNQFFSTIFIPREGFSTAKVSSKALDNDPYYVKQMSAETTMDYSSATEQPMTMDIFIGPNLYPLLSDLDNTIATDEDLELTSVIPLGWSIFRWISTLIIIPVFTFLNGFISNYGIIILLLTIFIKVILFPFTYKSFMSQAKMRVLQPEIKAINEKYPGQENSVTRSQKTMELYGKVGASPFSGCLPMLLQMPILVAMFWFFPSCIELRGESFLWAHNLAAPDVVLTLPFSIPFYGSHVSLFCLMMTVVNVFYTRINMQNQPGGDSMPGMKWMMYLMPLMFLFFFNDYASGLSYYYFLSLLITIIQTWIFRKCVNHDKVRQKMMENAKKPRKKNGWLARLEEAQRQQQAAMREAQKGKNKR